MNVKLDKLDVSWAEVLFSALGGSGIIACIIAAVIIPRDPVN